MSEGRRGGEFLHNFACDDSEIIEPYEGEFMTQQCSEVCLYKCTLCQRTQI
jgi:hypothetical protein